MSGNILTIRLVGFNAQEIELFSAILALAEARLQQTWNITDENRGGDFFIFKDGRHVPISPEPPMARCLFYVSDSTVSEHCFDRHIVVDKDNVPRLSFLIAVLNRLGNQSAPIPDEPSQMSETAGVGVHASASALFVPASVGEDIMPSDPDGKSADSAVFCPDQGLLKALLQLETFPVALTANNVVLWLDPAKGLYFCPLTLERLIACCAPENLFAVEPMSEPELQRLVVQEKLSPRPLSSLVWYVVFKSSQGRLLQGTSAQDIVHLLRWPDLGLPECRNYVKLAAFMHSNSMALADIATATHIPLGSVYDFYNACYLTGLIEKVTNVQRHEKHIDGERQNLLKKIRNRLMG
ncbi:hypothetical protein [Methylovulum sp.]|uniref:hypothetical protein n=2 Tax=Methylovulum sp. TaxID=1916980 RepID=UPI002609FB59|nr:hypothetical protein [Methylovulum sp.]MDD5126331.1 hypothetical protein [Methylovulum sp.]